jgi:hypothetical protein
VATLFAHGIGAGLPSGFEGRIVKRQGSGIEVANAVAQFSTFALPSDVGDFGGGAVNLMGNDDIFAVLFEYGPDSVGTRLFAHQGMPRPLGTADFQPYVLRRGLTGQSGTQWFFTESGRPFTLYVVLGSHARRSVLVPRVNRLLEGLTIEPSPLPAVAGVPWN